MVLVVPTCTRALAALMLLLRGLTTGNRADRALCRRPLALILTARTRLSVHSIQTGTILLLQTSRTTSHMPSLRGRTMSMLLERPLLSMIWKVIVLLAASLRTHLTSMYRARRHHRARRHRQAVMIASPTNTATMKAMTMMMTMTALPHMSPASLPLLLLSPEFFERVSIAHLPRPASILRVVRKNATKREKDETPLNRFCK